jgi:integrase/recombinase XerC
VTVGRAAPGPSLGEAVTEYLADCEARRLSQATVRAYRLGLRQLLAVVPGHLPIADLSRAQVRRALAFYGRGELKPSSLHALWRRWSAFFSWCVAEGLLQHHPMERMRAPRIGRLAPRILTATEIRRLFEAIELTPLPALRARDRAMLAVALDTGLRRSELLGLDVDDVDLDTGRVRVRRGKGRADRVTFLGSQARTFLREYMERWRHVAPGERALFVALQTGRRLSEASLYKRLRQYAKSAGLRAIHPHALRHTFSTLFLVQGGDVAILQQLLGHRQLTTTQRYLHLRPYVAEHARHGVLDRLVGAGQS